MHRRPFVLQVTTFLSTWCLVATLVHGSTIGDLSYELGISTDINLLRDPSDPVNQLSATWKTSSEIAVARETPLFRLTNTSSSADITSFFLHINELDRVFDAIVIAEAPPELSPVLLSPTDSVQGAGVTSKLGFSFSDRPLRPTESFAFWVDLDPVGDAPPAIIDFRNVLWDGSGNDREDNTLVQVTFDSGELAPVPLFEYVMANQVYDSRMSDGVSGQSLVFPMTRGADSIGAFFFQHSAAMEQAPLPEPDSLALMSVGLIILSALWRREFFPSRGDSSCRQRSSQTTR